MSGHPTVGGDGDREREARVIGTSGPRTARRATPPPPRRSFVPPLDLPLVVLAVVAGVAMRAWILRSGFGAIDGDEAVVGLMARHVLRGEFDAFFWGQVYGGTLEPMLTAAAIRAFGDTSATLKAVPIALTAVSVVLLWRVALRLLPARLALVPPLLFWVFPPAFVLASTKARGFYGVALVCTVSVLLLAMRLRDRASRADLLALGVVLGIGFWTAPHTVFFGLPIVLWLVVRKPDLVRLAWLPLAGAVAGALPWILFNVITRGASLETSSVLRRTYPERVWDYATQGLPAIFGLKMSYVDGWTVPLVLGAPLTVVLAALVLSRFRFEDPVVPTFVLYPLLLASVVAYWSEPRYAIFIAPLALLALAGLMRHAAIRYLGLLAAVALSVAGFAALVPWSERTPADYETEPGDLSRVVRLLDERGITRVYGDYWVSYRLPYETHERIIATPLETIRYCPYDRAVVESPRPAYVLSVWSPHLPKLLDSLRRDDVSVERLDTHPFVTIVPSSPVHAVGRPTGLRCGTEPSPGATIYDVRTPGT